MRVLLNVAVAVLSIFPGVGAAQKTASAAAPDPFKNEAIVFEKSETTYRMHADGTGERDVHTVMRIQSQGAAQQFGVLAFSYASANETPAIKFVRVHKADGSTVDTPVADAIEMPAEVTREAPLYSDLKEKHLPVRSLSPGDTLEYEVDTAINKTDAPNQFWGVYHFTAPGTTVVLAEVLTLEVPADKYVQVWSPNHKPVTTEHDGARTYVWNVAQLVTAPKNTGDDANKPAPPKDPDEDADGKKIPSVAWTTFHNWAEVGDWYRGLALGRTAPDDAVKAKAAELTKDAKTPEDQVRALYNYVSQHNRYIGIDFGIGRFQPHGAAEVLANQYGDCKDKDTLLEALLHAQGFTTTPALIGAGIAPVPEVPSPAVFNHVITTVNLAGAQIWLDSTPQAAPYRYLVPMIRDEKALVIPADAPATLQSTPANPPYAFTEDFAAKGALDKDGKLTAQMSVTCHDDSELILRALAVNIAPNDWDKASQYISSASGFGGTTSNTQFAHADDNSVPMTMTYDYTRHPYGDWDNHRIVPLFPYAEFPALESDSTEPQDDIQLGSPRTLRAVSRIKLPDGYRTDLPDAVHVKTDFAIYDKTYKFEGQEIIAERTIVVLKKKVPKEQWKAYYDFTKKVGVVDGESWISLIAPLPTFPLNSIGHDTSGTAANAKSDTSAEKKGDSGDKKSPVSADVKVTGKPIGTPVAWSDDEKAQIARAQKSGPEAMRKELAELQAKRYLPEWEKRAAETPDDARIVLGLANTQKMSGDPDAGRKTAQGFLDKHPDNALAAEYLAAVETQDGDYGTALRTLQGAAEKNPTDVPLKINVSQALRRLNRNEDAAAMAKTAVAAADSPGLLNDAAYSLSETGLDLDVAEAASRKSIDELEAKSATITTEEVNSRAFGDANLLIASWDTLGWILNAEGKADAAQPLIQAAWRASLRSEIGDHLAQIEEQAGHKDEAATTYGLAQSALDQNSPDEVRQHITNALARLKAAGVKAGRSGPDALQDLRTWKIKCPADVSGWGAFRLVIATSGVVEVQQMSGSGKIDGVKPAVAAMKFPELLWPGSKAHLLRSAVVSCTAGAMCDVVMVPDGGLQTEAAAGPVAQ